MKEEPGTVVRVVTPIRSMVQRFAYVLLLGAAVGILVWGRTDPRVFEQARMALIDSTTPVLNVLSHPVATVADILSGIRELADLRAINASLKVENARLLEWQHAARTLLEENDQLRVLLNFAGDENVHSVTGRVIGDSSGPFVRSLLVNVGTQDKVRRGHAAVTGDGLLGRVASAGERSSHILLLSDLNSRIPVLVEDTRERAILAGDNSRRPRLTFVSANSEVTVGSRIVTSGHGSIFPTGLPIGVVAEIGDLGIRIKTFASAERLEFIRLVDYGLEAVISDRDEEMVGVASCKR